METSPQRELPDRIVSRFSVLGLVTCRSMAAASSESRNTHTFLTVPVPSGYAPAKPLRASARSWRLLTDRIPSLGSLTGYFRTFIRVAPLMQRVYVLETSWLP